MSLNGEAKLTANVPQPNCPACAEQRMHTEADWRHHPLKGHGLADHGQWSHPELERK